MANASYQPKVYREQGGNRQVIASGGSLDVESGGELDLESGGALKIAGTAVTATAAELNEVFLQVYVNDLSAERSYYMVSPHAGTISAIRSVVDAAVATANITLTFSGPGGSMTGGVVTIATAGSGAGDIDTATPSTNNVLTAGQAISFVVTGGGAGGTPGGHIVATLTR